MKIAVITGASSGLGREFVRKIAEQKKKEDIDEIWAVAKAFLYRYSRGLRREVMGRGIQVTAVCPYWIKDTGFISRARDSRGRSRIHHFLLASRVSRVAGWALLDSRLGLAVSTPGPVCMIHRIAAKFIPSFLMMDLWEVLRRL